MFQKAVKHVSGPKFILPAIDGSTVKQKLFLMALLVIAVAWPFMVSRGSVDIATMTMIYIILGLGLNVVVGLSGLLVLGYGGFYAIGAYTLRCSTTIMVWVSGPACRWRDWSPPPPVSCSASRYCVCAATIWRL